MTQYQSTIADLPDEVVLSVRGVSKKFCRNLRRSMWYGIQDLSRNLLGMRDLGKPGDNLSVPMRDGGVGGDNLSVPMRDDDSLSVPSGVGV